MLFRFWENISIKVKLMVIYFAINVLTIAIIFSIMAGYDYYSFRSVVMQGIQAQAKLIEGNIAAAISANDKEKANAILAAFQFSPQVEHVQLLSADGRLFAEYGKPNVSHIHPAQSTGDQTSISMLDRWRYIHYQQSILSRSADMDSAPDMETVSNMGTAVGSEQATQSAGAAKLLGTLAIHASLQRLHISLLVFSLITMLAAVLGLTGAYLLSRRVNFGISKPLRDLTQLIHQIIRTQDFTVRSPLNTTANSSNEIGLLAHGLNDMLDHIEKHDAALESELSQRKLAEKSLDHLAHYDNVTGLQNRHYFNQYLQCAIEEARSADTMLCVMFIDLDNFKIVNDTLGHQSGDILLKEAAMRMQQTLTADEVICRIGGDEFAIVIKDVKLTKQAERIAKEIISVLHQAFDLHNNEIYVGASIGISFFPTQANDLSSLLSNADAAMYHAKSLGKNNFQHYHADMEGRIRRRLNMENSLRRAIEADELELYYQPQIEVNTLRITGFEALLRWHHPKMGTISPSEFVPLAEESGLILPIGNWVMVTACYQAKLWQKMFSPDIRVAINFTARQLKDEAMVEKVLHALAITNLPAHTLDLELTESSLMDNSDESVEKMKELRRAGIHISIDDFGTGFSSLSYLKRFPLNALKIDRSFISDIPNDEDDVAITNAIIALANTLHIEVIAEGVETLEQLNYLRENNCRYAQGNFMGQPLPARRMEELLRSLKTPMHIELKRALP